MVTILFVYWSLHIGACVYIGLVGNSADATLYQSHVTTIIGPRRRVFFPSIRHARRAQP